MKDKNVFSIIGAILSIISTIIVILNAVAPNTSEHTKIILFLLAVLLVLLTIILINIERIPFFKNGHGWSRSLLIGISSILTLTIFIVSGKALWDEWHHQDQLIAVFTHDQNGLEIEAFGEKTFLNCLSTNTQFEYEVKTSSDEDVNIKAEIQMTDFVQFSIDNISKYDWEDITLNVLSSQEKSEDTEIGRDDSYKIPLNGDLDHNGCAAEIKNQKIEKKSFIIVDYTPTVKESGKYTLQLVVTYYDNENKKQKVESEKLTFCYLNNSLKEIVSEKIAKTKTGEQTQSETEAQTYFELGKAFYQAKDYDSALESFQETLRIRHEVLREESKNTADSFFWVGYMYYLKDEYDPALDNYKKSLDIRGDVLGEKNVDTALTYSVIGNAHYFKATSYYLIGNMDDAKEEYGQALDNYNKSLNIQMDVLDEENEYTARSYYRIGNVYYYIGEYGQALDNYNKSLNIRSKVLGEKNEDTAWSYYSIGAVHFAKAWSYYQNGNKNLAKEEYDQALYNFKKSLNIRSDVLGEKNEDTAYSYFEIGFVHFDKAQSYQNGNEDLAKKEYDQALDNFKKSLNIRRDVLGEENQYTALSYFWIGKTYYGLGEYKNALDYFQNAYNIQKIIFGEENINTQLSKEALEDTRRKVPNE